MRNTSIEEIYKIYQQNPFISKDTRKIENGCIYFALKGDNFDGNKFAEEAIDRGAAYAIIDQAEYKKGERYLLVDNCLKTLQDLANYHRRQLSIPIIGITGSNGKTTTKELIATVLLKKYKVIYTEGNYNNHIGVPLTLLKINKHHEIAVIEMGANHQGEIDFLSRICAPTHGLITNIGKAHLEGFGGVEGIKKGKSELYHFLAENKGIVFINNDDPILKNLLPNLKTISYGKDLNSSTKGALIETHPNLKGKWFCNSKIGKIESKLYGEYNFYNVLAAICIGNTFKVSSADIDCAINDYESDMNRSQLIQKNNYKVYLDAYNANPTSMRLAISNFEKSHDLKKVLILGDMFELGNESAFEHKTIIEQVEDSNAFEHIIFVGQNFFNEKKLSPKMTFFEEIKDAKNWFLRQSKDKISFLIKGSRGMALERILQ